MGVDHSFLRQYQCKIDNTLKIFWSTARRIFVEKDNCYPNNTPYIVDAQRLNTKLNGFIERWGLDTSLKLLVKIMESQLEHTLMNSHKKELISFLNAHPEFFEEAVTLAI